MKIGAVTLAYQDEGIIQGTLKCLQPFVDSHIVVLSEKPYFGKGGEADRTEEIALDLGADVVKGNWSLDHFQRNLGNSLMSDMDWILTFDSDEMMTKEELVNLILFLDKTEHTAVAVNPEIYWKTTDYRLRPKPSYMPIIAMKPSVRFTHIRNIDAPTFAIYKGEMHHLSWCAPKDIYKKVTCYAHAPDFDGEEWYMKEYLTWQEDMTARLPDGEYKAIYEPLPKELYEHLGNSTDTN